MSQDSREQFEQAFCEENSGVDLEGKVLPGALAALKEMRMGESYKERKIARAWYWWKRARAGIVVVLPKLEDWLDMDGRPNTCRDYQAALASSVEAAGVKVAE